VSANYGVSTLVIGVALLQGCDGKAPVDGSCAPDAPLPERYLWSLQSRPQVLKDGRAEIDGDRFIITYQNESGETVIVTYRVGERII
jgi:hypothetical protein